MIGGVRVDEQGATSVPRSVGRRRGRPAAGCTAPTGWPRTACWRASSTAPRRARRPPPGRWRSPTTSTRSRWRTPRSPEHGEPLDLADIRNSLKSLMWRSGRRVAGRGRIGGEAHESISAWRQYVLTRQTHRAGGLGAAESAASRRADDQRSAAKTDRVAGRPPADRFPRARRPAGVAPPGDRESREPTVSASGSPGISTAGRPGRRNSCGRSAEASSGRPAYAALSGIRFVLARRAPGASTGLWTNRPLVRVAFLARNRVFSAACDRSR